MKYWLAVNRGFADYEGALDTLPDKVASVSQWYLGTTSAFGGRTQPFFYLAGFTLGVLPSTWTQANVNDFSVLYDMAIVEANVTEDEYENIMTRLSKISVPLGSLAEEAQAGAPLL